MVDKTNARSHDSAVSSTSFPTTKPSRDSIIASSLASSVESATLPPLPHWKPAFSEADKERDTKRRASKANIVPALPILEEASMDSDLSLNNLMKDNEVQGGGYDSDAASEVIEQLLSPAQIITGRRAQPSAVTRLERSKPNGISVKALEDSETILMRPRVEGSYFPSVLTPVESKEVPSGLVNAYSSPPPENSSYLSAQPENTLSPSMIQSNYSPGMTVWTDPFAPLYLSSTVDMGSILMSLEEAEYEISRAQQEGAGAPGTEEIENQTQASTTRGHKLSKRISDLKEQRRSIRTRSSGRERNPSPRRQSPTQSTTSPTQSQRSGGSSSKVASEPEIVLKMTSRLVQMLQEVREYARASVFSSV
jgi:hypothetical protein